MLQKIQSLLKFSKKQLYFHSYVLLKVFCYSMLKDIPAKEGLCGIAMQGSNFVSCIRHLLDEKESELYNVISGEKEFGLK